MNHGALLNHFFNRSAVCLPFGFYMTKPTNYFTLSAEAAQGSTVLYVNEVGTDATIGEALSIRDGGRGQQTLVIATTANSITIGAPLEQDYTTSSELYTGPWNMNVIGSSASPNIFRVKPPEGEILYIEAITFSIQDSADTMDDGTFGGLDALTNGIILRKKDHLYRNYFQIVNNSGFKEDGWTVTYVAKPPAGTTNAVSGKKNFSEFHGINILLNGNYEEELQLFIQDDISSLDLFSMKLHGHTFT